MLGLQGDDGCAAEEGCGAACHAESPVGFEGVADSRDLTCLSGPKQRAQDSGKEVGVFVRVDVGDGDAGGLKSADLGGGFGDDFLGADAEGEEVADEVGECVAEGSAVGAESGDLFRRQSGLTVDEEDVAADF
jgi:hypothetical protein